MLWKTYTEYMQRACDAVISHNSSEHRTKLPWWDPELEELKHDARTNKRCIRNVASKRQQRPSSGTVLSDSKQMIRAEMLFLGLECGYHKATQYDSMPQQETEDALYDLITYIYSELNFKQNIFVVSLDIEGVFDKALWPALETHLLAYKCPVNLYVMVRGYL
ncbi:hypothetical protein EVAR_85987_1 [Eumeta japonica]|uniref:Reverse transcriptase domain-containing protein n=1 Tax=Eumeta variegata TaxID=151549 RepID=A0A4C1UJ89_EUMVA|nr:hypothetical protein EVAR_85987_1 [Eumeta japonica]